MNLIIGAAFGFGVPELRNFVKSARRFHPEDDVVLIINSPSDELAAFLAENRVKIIAYSLIETTPSGMPHWKAAINFRMYKVLDYIIENPHYADIFYADTRDVVFQDNLFKHRLGLFSPTADSTADYLYFFCEDPNMTLGGCECNRMWVKTVFNEAMFNEIRDKKIVCSGTILGSRDRMIWFFRKYAQLMPLNRILELGDISTDQATTNVIAHKYNEVGAVIMDSGDIVGTLAHTIYRKGPIHVEGDFVTTYDRRPAVIHQHDRREDLKAHYDKMYA